MLKVTIPRSQILNKFLKSPRNIGTHNPKKNNVHEKPNLILLVTPDGCRKVIFKISPLIFPIGWGIGLNMNDIILHQSTQFGDMWENFSV
ncbi:hypothetical protein D7Z26_09435 [Cohnella endophytica]|uniref:Uncharacterized protein n=1 Tax=Cohnella endophytica TaxID=2419778 RepID=A0A494Y1X5_9BACL|nr:hypothetical protein D7Z26_09435 [Cohnella endophytica]